MKTTGRAAYYDELEQAPEKPFLKDLRNDIERINKHYTPKEAIVIKKAMILELTNSL